MIRICKLLPPKDLKSVMLVCRKWMQMGEDPTLWTWSRVRVKSREDFHILSFRRFQLVQELEIGDDCDLYENCTWTEEDRIELFEVMINLPALNMLNSMHCNRSSNLSCVGTDLVLNVYKRLREVFVYYQLSHEQSNQLYSAMAQNHCSLKILKIWDDSTTKLSPRVFASVVTNVEEVGLATSNITHEQMEALFVALTNKDGCRLRKLDLYSCNTHDIEPALIGEAVNKLEEFEIANTWVKSDQIWEILIQIVNGESKLNKLMLGDLFFSDFKDVDSAIVEMVRDKFGNFFHFDNDDMDVYGEDQYDPSENEEGYDLNEIEVVGESVDSEENLSVGGDDDSEYVQEVKRLSDIYIVD